MLEFYYKDVWSYSAYKGFYYILACPDPEKPNRLLYIGSKNSCREFFVKRYREIIYSSDVSTPWVRKAYALVSYGKPSLADFKKFDDELKHDASRSLYIVNSFEKEHKWPLTKLHLVECINIEVPMVFFSGPRKWTMSPYLMSIWSLCVRLGRNHWLPKKILTFDHENLVRQLAISAKLNNNDDGRQLSKTIRMWDRFMSLYSELFAGVDRKDHWSESHLNGSASRPEGILKLIDGSTHYTELYDKFNKLI